MQCLGWSTIAKGAHICGKREPVVLQKYPRYVNSINQSSMKSTLNDKMTTCYIQFNIMYIVVIYGLISFA